MNLSPRPTSPTREVRVKYGENWERFDAAREGFLAAAQNVAGARLR